MTEAVLTYNDKSEETIKCNYTKTREGWLEVALTTDKPHKRIFIPAHMLERVTTVDFGEDENTRLTRGIPRNKGWGD